MNDAGYSGKEVVIDRDKRSVLYYEATPLQRYIAILGIVSGFIGFVLILIWAADTDSYKDFLGGVNFKEHIFALHPVFMTLGMVVFGLTSILTYRVLPFPKWVSKSVHMWLHSFALISVTIGLTCIIVAHDYTDHNSSRSYKANLWSIHDYIGLTAIFIFVENYVLGLWYFVSPFFSTPVDCKNYRTIHIFLGGLGVTLAAMAIEVGIMEVMTENCENGYTVTSADWNPAANYHLLSLGCQVANGAGILFLLAIVCCITALYQFRDYSSGARGRGDQTPEEKPLLSETQQNYRTTV